MNYSVFYSNEDDVASPDLLWPMGDYTYPYLPVPQNTLPGPIGPSTAGAYAPDFNTGDNAAFSQTITTEMEFADPPTQGDFTNEYILNLLSLLVQSLIDANSAVSQPQLVDPLATYSLATTPDSGVSPTPTTSTSQDNEAWVSNFLQSLNTTPASSPGHGWEAGWVAPEYGATVSEVTTSPARGDASGTSWHIPVAPGDVTLNVTETPAPAVALGKRRREAEQPLDDGDPTGSNTHEMPPPKRARGGVTIEGILKAGRSATRTHPKPAARIPTKITDKPKEAGRGAERLATPSSQGIYQQPLPGPSFQQGCAVFVADGKSSRVEGSVDEEAVNHIDSAVQQQHEEVTKLFAIPRKFKPEHRLFLQASESDFARGAVQAIKCRLCPETKLKNFEELKRHCRTTEAHPSDIHFCGRCGDYFARSDSLTRHSNKPPAECRKVTPAKAAEKRRVTEEAHEVFIRQLEHGLMTGEGIMRPFTQIIKEKYPESSKKRAGGST